MSTEVDKTTNAHTTSAAEALVTTSSGAATEATLGARIGGYVIDIIVVLVISLVVSSILGRINGALSLLGTLAAMAYLLLRDSLPFLGGQSIGKKVVKIKAVTEEGASLSGNWGPDLIRNAVLFIPFFPLVELVVLIAKNGKPGGLRRLGDEWGKTKVIKLA